MKGVALVEIKISPAEGIKKLEEILTSCKGIPLDIVLSPGIYFVEKSIELNSQHKNLRVIGDAEGVRIIGGRQIKSWKLVQDEAILSRMDEAVRQKVFECDLLENGITETGSFRRRGYGGDLVPSQAELFCNGSPMSISQFPKKGEYLQITGYEKELINEGEEKIGHPEYGFYYENERPLQWTELNGIWAHGYWCWDWANSYEHVTKIDANRRYIELKDIQKGRVRGFKPGQRFYFLNILEEVNTPGDYYIDSIHNKIYFYPESIGEDTEILLSMMETPIFNIRNCENVTISGLQLECVRGNAVNVLDTIGLTIDNCHFKNIGNYAIDIVGGKYNKVVNSTIHNCGDGGIKLVGGDRMTLEPAEAQISNNHIYQIATWSRCYRPAIHPSGVGISITHNLIHDCPHTAILFSGNDIRIEYNEIYNVCMETGDAGAIYSGRDVTFRGNHISHNYIHHLGGVGFGTMGIYNDDVLSGTIMESNYFYEVGRAVMLGGGVDYIVKNNIFVKCYPAIHMDSRAAHTEFFWGPCYEHQKEKLYNGVQSFLHPNGPEVILNCTKGHYIEKYPELARLAEVYDRGRQLTASAEILQNVFCSKPLFRYYWDGRNANEKKIYDCGELVELSQQELCDIFDTRHDVRADWSPGKGDWRFARNYTASRADFEDAEWGIIGLKPDSRAFEYGHEPSDFYSIGLIQKNRNDNPPKVLTCLTYPYKDKDQKLTLGIRNTENYSISASVHIYTNNPKIELYKEDVAFTLAPQEEIFVEVGDICGEERFTVEARGTLPGIRPSRAENVLGNWIRY